VRFPHLGSKHPGQKYPGLKIPWTKNKSQNSGKFSSAEKRCHKNRVMTTYHRKSTVKKPHQNTSISQKPRKKPNSPSEKKDIKTVA
jgi:hypothetical protein